MGDKIMLKKNKNAFWQALLLALAIFAVGIFLGFILESSRVDRIAELSEISELNLLDVKLQSELYTSFPDEIDCGVAIEENIRFADRVYEEAKLLDRYETAARISRDIQLQHKRYDLLRTMFWLNSIKLKKECDADFHTVTYFYQYNEPGVEKSAEQAVFSNLLRDLKENRGSEIMLIPIAADNNITSVEILMDSYGVTELPSILIDEEVIIAEVIDFEQLMEIIDNM